MNKLATLFNRATNAVSEKAAAYIPASRASKAAKMMVLAFTLMMVFPMQAQAAAFITEAIDILGVVIIAIGGGLGIWGVVNLLEGYGNDNPGANRKCIYFRVRFSAVIAKYPCCRTPKSGTQARLNRIATNSENPTLAKPIM